MPGVGAHSRFRVASPGKLIARNNAGETRVLVDGSSPTAASLNLIDVNAPDVSYDGKRIVFAGLPAGNHSGDPANNPGAWRIYEIAVDGSGLRQITRSDQISTTPSSARPRAVYRPTTTPTRSTCPTGASLSRRRAGPPTGTTAESGPAISTW